MTSSPYLYSASANAFFDRDLHGDQAPADAVPISVARHARLLALQAAGSVIGPDGDGRPSAHRHRVSEAARRRHLIARGKREAARRIDLLSPIWRQCNDNADLAVAAVQLAASGATTIDTGPAMARRAAVERLRARSDAIENAVRALAPAEFAEFDPADDVHWS